MKYEFGKITFASGNLIDGVSVFGLAISADDSEITAGWDSVVWAPDLDGDFFGAELSPADRAEIADHMIARWQQWKAECAS